VLTATNDTAVVLLEVCPDHDELAWREIHLSSCPFVAQSCLENAKTQVISTVWCKCESFCPPGASLSAINIHDWGSCVINSLVLLTTRRTKSLRAVVGASLLQIVCSHGAGALCVRTGSCLMDCLRAGSNAARCRRTFGTGSVVSSRQASRKYVLKNLRGAISINNDTALANGPLMGQGLSLDRNVNL